MGTGTGTGTRIGVMGGTFDPIHNGHLVAASEVAARLQLDQVVFVPTATPNFKQAAQVTSDEHRYVMVELATASNPLFTVSRVDIDRGGVTYTVDTLRDLRAQESVQLPEGRRGGAGESQWFFITGADAIAHIHRWKNCDELWDLATFVAVTRPGHTLDVTHTLDVAGVPQGSVIPVEIPALDISSTTCRQRIASGMPVRYLMPELVERYISKHGIYGRSAG